MKAFWWFKEKSIAGMGRPGFNKVHWFDLSFSEALLLGWFGKFSSGMENLVSFRSHLREHGSKIRGFYNVDDKTTSSSLEIFNESSGILEMVERLNCRVDILESFEIKGDRLHFELSKNRLRDEIDFLKKQNVSRIVSLTESHHNKEHLLDHFGLHHISIEDLSAPELEQAFQLVEIIKSSQKNRETIAVHCMAGIGRTSTMLMASHILMGEKREGIETLLKKKNPTFVLTGTQREFVQSLSTR